MQTCLLGELHYRCMWSRLTISISWPDLGDWTERLESLLSLVIGPRIHPALQYYLHNNSIGNPMLKMEYMELMAHNERRNLINRQNQNPQNNEDNINRVSLQPFTILFCSSCCCQFMQKPSYSLFWVLDQPPAPCPVVILERGHPSICWRFHVDAALNNIKFANSVEFTKTGFHFHASFSTPM